MNNIAVLPYIGLHALQIQNVKRNTTKKVNINELNFLSEAKDVVENVVKGGVISIENTNEEKSTTKIDDLPSYTKEETNKNQQI